LTIDETWLVSLNDDCILFITFNASSGFKSALSKSYYPSCSELLL